MSSTNRGAARAPGDFYRTPEWCTKAILPHIPLADRIVDPCCGDGAIMRCLVGDVHGIEIDEALANSVYTINRATGYVCPDVRVADALAVDWAADVVVMNPPFSLALEFVQKSIAAVGPNGTVAALLRLAFLEGKCRATFHLDNPSDVYVLPKRPSFTENGKTDSCAYAWFVWGPGRGGRWQVLECDGTDLRGVA